ncbi:uncharacterized protein EAE98_011674 [Botrytis deweyae]|uniref:Uncharacterized protein n=1 Tax=Botrytis deweyae TaxID=2478750 RepID=A0ABQ7I5E8_9HELO|nr:uncharacterized protein EAE98_011674 [Botrytis deweyae]KAF7913123.1 hypothetical protein EAE98_011674 [Botrytis deweyae]
MPSFDNTSDPALDITCQIPISQMTNAECLREKTAAINLCYRIERELNHNLDAGMVENDSRNVDLNRRILALDNRRLEINDQILALAVAALVNPPNTAPQH